ncbi:MAG: tetratricopeptide repeat protein, partial [Sedimentisphaerales bacterium]|nr:tetratricopeptide repeat protein [Sedimentisphaerales bacterium]
MKLLSEAFGAGSKIVLSWLGDLVMKELKLLPPVQCKYKYLVLVLLFSATLFTDAHAAGKPPANKKAPTSNKLRALARIYMAYGDYDKAQPLAERALTVAKTANDPDLQVSSCLIDLGWLYKNQGRLDEAEQMCQMGLGLQKKIYYEEHPYLAYTFRILSSIHQEQGRYRQATNDMDQAMAIMRQSHLQDDPTL